MRPYLRVLADDRHVAVGNAEAPLAGPGAGVVEKDPARGTLPLRVGRRKMPADVAVGQRAVNRVGQRVHRDIGVGMALQPTVEGNVDAAERDVAARPEAVHVVAVAGADISHRSSEQGFGAGEILGRGDLEVRVLARNDGDVQPRGKGYL